MDWQAYDKERHEIARRLRRRQTGPELALWQVLRGKRLAGLKFRRKAPIYQWFADFYCPSHLVVVDVGDKTEDPRRAVVFKSLGLRVVLVTHEEIALALPAVLERIRATAYQR